MRKASPSIFCIILVGVLIAALGAAAASGDQEHNCRRAVIIDEDGERISLSLAEDGILRIREGDGDERYVEIDLEGIGEIVEDALEGALEGVGEALDELSELQIDLNLGRDNSLIITDDGDEIVFDFGEILAEVGEVLEEALSELDFEDWDHHWDDHGGSHCWRDDRDDDEDWASSRHHRHARVDHDFDDSERDELEQEVEQLKEEIEALQKDLRRIKSRQHR